MTRHTRQGILTLLLSVVCVALVSVNIQWGIVLDVEARQTEYNKHIDTLEAGTNNITRVYSKNSTKRLWRFYNKDLPSLYDAFTNSSALIFIFQTKKGHCSRCISDSAAQLPLIEYGGDGDKRVGVPRWECRFQTAVVAGSVMRDPHGHIFVLICPGIPSVPRVEVRAQAEGEEALVYTDIEYEPRHKQHKYKLTACTMVRSDTDIYALTEWVRYHQFQGWDHFSVYVDGPGERIAAAFRDDNWTVSVVDWNWPDRGFQHQQAEMNSCLYRYRESAEWVAFFDMDEFFQPMTTTILDILGKVPSKYGGWAAQHVLFVPPPNSHGVNLLPITQTFVERSMDALPFPERSKCIVRPYEVDTMGVHEITSGNTLTRVANPSEEARLNHYRVGLDLNGITVHDTSMQQYANTLQLTKHTKHRPFVAVYLTGQLGNQLFQAASSYGIALARGVDWCIPYLNGSILEKSVQFSLPPLSKCVPEGVHVADEAGDFMRFQSWMLHEHPGESMLVRTYLQSFLYFANVSRLPFELREQVRANEWTRKNDITAGIHVRRTDMLHNLGNDPTIEYFKKALALMRDAVGPIHTKNVVVCTDDPAWVHAHTEVFGGMNVRANTDYYEDMAVLASCQHLILSIGTFGWWAAYLRASPGHTFYFAEPLRRPSPSYVEHFPASWTPISLTHDETTKQVCEVTLVTAYFQMPSKHSEDKYHMWIKNALSLRACFVIFTSASMKSLFVGLSEGREKFTDLRIIDLKEESTHLNQSQAFWEHQFSIDPEQEIHKGFELYWVWSLKSSFVKDAIGNSMFRSNYFFWIDIGCLRDGVYNGRVIDGVPAQVRQAPHSVFFALVNPFSAADIELDQDGYAVHHLSTDHIAGACWGGEAQAVLRFHGAFQATFRRLADKGRFVGKDQTVINTICVQTKYLCALVQPGIFNPWFDMVPMLLGDASSDMGTPSFAIDVHERVLVATMITDDADNYVRGACALIHSIKKHSMLWAGLAFVTFELEYKPLLADQRKLLKRAGWSVQSMPHITARDGATPFGRFVDQFSKLNFWNMTEYDRVVYLDSDCYVTGSLNELLFMDISSKDLWVTRDIRGNEWVSGFNMGVFVINPSMEAFQRLIHAKDDKTIAYEVAMAEQGFLNVEYSKQWGDIGFQNNANLAAYTADRKQWDHYTSTGINVIHYTMQKPWACGEPFVGICQLWLEIPIQRLIT